MDITFARRMQDMKRVLYTNYDRKLRSLSNSDVTSSLINTPPAVEIDNLSLLNTEKRIQLMNGTP